MSLGNNRRESTTVERACRHTTTGMIIMKCRKAEPKSGSNTACVRVNAKIRLEAARSLAGTERPIILNASTET